MGEQVQGESLGQYRITECLAEGHIARLCKAVDRTTGRSVLIRIVSPTVSRNEQIRPILEDLRDPQSPRRIQDPHILQILEVGTRGDSFYIVHEDFGQTLDLSAQRMELRAALEMARAIAECLRAVHGHRLVHGDLKPQNVRFELSSRGKPQVKLAMADLAHQVSDSLISVFGEMVGTPKYMAPEVIKGQRGNAQADMFSLGVILYELFSGHEPFPSNAPTGYLHSNVVMTAEPLTVVDSRIPVELGKVVGRLLDPSPRMRYRSVQSLIDDLDRVESRLEGIAPDPLPPGADSVFAPASSTQATSPAAIWRLATVGLLVVIALLLAVIAVNTLRKPFEEKEPFAFSTTTLSLVEEFPPATQPATPASDEWMLLSDNVDALVDEGRTSEAVAMLQEFIATRPRASFIKAAQDKAAEILLNRAQRLELEGKSTDALSEYRRIARDFPNSPSARQAAQSIPALLLGNARALEARGELQQAIDALQVIAIQYATSPAAATALELLPSIRLRYAQSITQADPNTAIDILRGGVKAGGAPEVLSQMRTTLSRLLVERGEKTFRNRDYAAAVADFREALSHDAESVRGQIAQREPEALALLALEYKDKGKPADAIAAWQELISRYPNNRWISRYATQMAPLTSAAGAVPAGQADDPAILWEMADKAVKANDSGAAQQILERLAKDFPNTVQGRRAAELLARDRLDAAMSALKNARMAEAREQLNAVVADYPKTTAGAAASRELQVMDNPPEGMLYIPESDFSMGLSVDKVDEIAALWRVPAFMKPKYFGIQVPAHTVHVPAFYMDKCEVTNAQYLEFVLATKRAAPLSPDWDEQKVALKGGTENLPVRFITWEDADAYAKWAGKRLPTEAEWEYAARGADGRLFPWGNEFSSAYCATSADENLRGPLPVGSFPRGESPYGILDMIGNVQEWTSSDFTAYPGAVTEGLLLDPENKVARGGSYDERDTFMLLTTTRYGWPPTARFAYLGFRCVKDVK